MIVRARVLVAGFGNVLLGDDGFGIAAVRALAGAPGLPAGVECFEAGIGGMHLVQQLMNGYEALMVLDAVERGSVPGTLHLLEPLVPDPDAASPGERETMLGDMHMATPARALVLARALHVLPPRVYLLGCQPATVEPSLDLSPAVADAVPRAVERLLPELRHLAAAVARVAGAPDTP